MLAYKILVYRLPRSYVALEYIQISEPDIVDTFAKQKYSALIQTAVHVSAIIVGLSILVKLSVVTL